MAGALFVTRKYPPSVGGMQTLARDVWATLDAGSDVPVRLVAHGGSNTGLPLFMVKALFRTVRLVRRGEVELVLTGDVVTYLLLGPWLRVLGVRHATMAMGKDVVWDQPLYRRWVRRGLSHVPTVLAISAATAQTVVDAGVPLDRVQVVRLGVEVPTVTDAERSDARREVRRRHGVPDDAVVVLSLGRLVRRKGVAWFVRSVLPRLDHEVVHLVAGDGVDAAEVRAAVEEAGQGHRVVLLGAVDDDDRELLMRGCDVFVQPNIPVTGDMEGFGLVAVEAAVRGALVVAADLEGLKDAVDPDVTGIVVAPEDADAWVTRLDSLLAEPDGLPALALRLEQACRARYSREAMGRELSAALGLAVTPVDRREALSGG